MKEEQMVQLAGWMNQVAQAPSDADLLERIRQEVLEVCKKFPAPGLASS